MTNTVEARIVALARFRDRIILLIGAVIVATVVALAANAVSVLRAENERLRADRQAEHAGLHDDLGTIKAALEGLRSNTTTADALERLSTAVDGLAQHEGQGAPMVDTRTPAGSPPTTASVPTTVDSTVPAVPTTTQPPCLTPTQLVGISLPCILR
jgi:hypothetical protein